MPPSSFDRTASPEPEPDRQAQSVVVLGRSPVNLVVLSRIAERAGMRAVTEAPERAASLIERICPAIVVLDGGPDLRDCDAAMGAILAQKRLNAGTAPFVIMLTPTNERPGAADSGGTIDAYVSKPITPERLQPLIEKLRDRRNR